MPTQFSNKVIWKIKFNVLLSTKHNASENKCAYLKPSYYKRINYSAIVNN